MIRIVKGELVIEVESEHDLNIVLDALKEPAGITKKQWDIAVPEGAMLKFFKAIQPFTSTNVYKMLMALKENPNGLTEYELKAKLGVDKGQAFGGMMGGITKNARNYGLEPSNIYTCNKSEDGQSMMYKLTEEMLLAINDAT